MSTPTSSPIQPRLPHPACRWLGLPRSRPIGVLGPIFAISAMPNRQKIHVDGLGFWGCISIKFILEPLSLWICFLSWIHGYISNDSGSTSGGPSWLIISHDVPPKMLWTMYSGSAMLKWFSLLVSNLIYNNGVSENGKCTCRQQDPSNKKDMASFLDSSQFLIFNIQINPERFTHPLQSLPGFEVRQLRFCSMHTINLGVLQALNGSLLSLLCSHGCLPVVFYCYPMCFLGYLYKYLPKVLLEYLSWCLAQDFWKWQHGDGWFSTSKLLCQIQILGPDQSLPATRLLESGGWWLKTTSWEMDIKHSGLKGHPKNWFYLLVEVEDLGRWSSVRRTALQVVCAPSVVTSLYQELHSWCSR